MTGSGLGNFGLGNVGIYGQQEWQKRAREQAFTNRFGQSMYNQTVFGGYGEGRKSPEEMRLDAVKYAQQPFSNQQNVALGSDIYGFQPRSISPLDIMAPLREQQQQAQAPQPQPASAANMRDMLRPENFKVRTRTTGGGITANITPSLDWYRDIQRLRFPQMGRMAYS